MEDVYVLGAEMTPFGKFHDRTLRSLAEEATLGVLKSVDMRPNEVGAAFVGNAVAGVMTGQENIRGQVLLRNTGLYGLPIYNVENACATSSTAFQLAWMSIASGQFDSALVLGAEKLTHADKKKSLMAFDSSLDLSERAELEELLDLPASERGTKSIFMDLYAAGITDGRSSKHEAASPKQRALVAVKNHENGSRNPKAQYRTPVTVDEVLNSRTIAEGLTLLMCAPIGDGAAALLLGNEKAAAAKQRKDVKIRATVCVSGRGDHEDQVPSVERAAELCYGEASLEPSDLDLAEVHDAAAPAEIALYEQLGFCRDGDGGELIESGDTWLGGRLPVNPSGGLLSRGHPIGATGAAQIAELYWQLTGQAEDRQVESPRFALAQNGGGFVGTDSAAMCVTILESARSW